MHTIPQPQAIGIRILLTTAIAFIALGVLTSRVNAQTDRLPERLYVDPERGREDYPGSRRRPVRTISGAIARLPDPLTRSVTIELPCGRYQTTGGRGMPDNVLELMVRMRPGVRVTIVGQVDERGRRPVLAWEGGRAMIDAREGNWSLEDVQIGTFTRRQRRGVMVAGPAHVALKTVSFRQRSLSDAGIYAHHGGQVSLYGAITLNEHLHDDADEETFCGIIATDHGLVRFREREGAALSLGNGSLSASYYGCIRLGCATARITSWGEQSNNLAINNGGRIDLHNTAVTLRAQRRRNTPIGLEHDGHILGEDARIVIEGENSMAIALQKASTFTCNDIALRGEFDYCLWASSGSMFVGRFLTDVGRIEATTGATVHVEKIDGALSGPVIAKRCGVISLPDRNVYSE
jgi:hypothetical protein